MPLQILCDQFWSISKVEEKPDHELTDFQRKHRIANISNTLQAMAVVKACNHLEDGYDYDFEEGEAEEYPHLPVFQITREKIEEEPEPEPPPPPKKTRKKK